MKITNMKSPNGNPVPNQFIITEHGRGALGNFKERKTFQSYGRIIAIQTTWGKETRTELDKEYWNFSKTTSRYRAVFLSESTKETEKKIASGEYNLTNLNR